MSHEHSFACRLIWTGSTKTIEYSREHQISIAGKPTLTLSSAPAFRGDGTLENPEDLLMAALSSCHFLSYAALCARKKIELVSYEDDAVGKMEMAAGKIRFVDVLLKPRCVISAGDIELATKLHDQAHAECFIASSVNFPVRHEALVSLAVSAK